MRGACIGRLTGWAGGCAQEDDIEMKILREMYLFGVELDRLPTRRPAPPPVPTPTPIVTVAAARATREQETQTQTPREECVSDPFECIVCMARKRTHMFMPCGHYAVCESCMRSDTCPVCDVAISCFVRVFMP